MEPPMLATRERQGEAEAEREPEQEAERESEQGEEPKPGAEREPVAGAESEAEAEPQPAAEREPVAWSNWTRLSMRRSAAEAVRSRMRALARRAREALPPAMRGRTPAS